MDRLLIFIFIAASSSLAQARVYDIYRADYTKGPFCSTIAGACASDVDFDSSFFQNPASLEAGRENWDYDYDFNKKNSLEPGAQKDNEAEESTFMAGFIWAGEKWGAGLSFTIQNDNVQSKASLTDDQGRSQAINVSAQASTYIFTAPLAYKYSNKLSFGTAVSFLYQNHNIDVAGVNSSSKPFSNLPTPSFTMGTIYKYSENLRLGSWFRTTSSYGYSMNLDFQSFGNQLTYKEDINLVFPWMLAIGASYMPFEDERTLFMDVDVVGATTNSYLMSYDTFTNLVNDKNLVKKGRNIVAEPRLGWRSAFGRESKATYSLGLYYENSRWEGEDGRMHCTGGVSYKWPLQFLIFDGVELMVGIDAARDFYQFFLTYR